MADTEIASADETGSLTEVAYRRLEELIVTLELRPGLAVSEKILVERLNLGRTPVREALHRLASEGLVEIMPRRGMRIAPIDLRKQVRLLETRRVLEALVARSAAVRASPEERRTLTKLADAFLTEGAVDYRRFLKIDHSFNLAVADAADNEFAVAALGQLHGLSRRFWHYYSGHEADLPHVAQIHARIAKAISEGNPDKADTAVSAHMDYIFTFTRAILEG